MRMSRAYWLCSNLLYKLYSVFHYVVKQKVRTKGGAGRSAREFIGGTRGENRGDMPPEVTVGSA